MSEIPEQTTKPAPDPIETMKRAFEDAFPDLLVTEIGLRKDTREVPGPDGWTTVEETGGFSCHIRAARRG